MDEPFTGIDIPTKLKLEQYLGSLKQTIIHVSHVPETFENYQRLIWMDEGIIQAVNGVYLEIPSGQTLAIVGESGSGKSTLANVISGHEDYEITKGNIFFKDQEINEFSPEERALEGVFMSFQYPVEIPGVTVTNFIKTAINESRKSKGLDEMPSSEMLKKIREKAALLEIDSNFLI